MVANPVLTTASHYAYAYTGEGGWERGTPEREGGRERDREREERKTNRARGEREGVNLGDC